MSIQNPLRTKKIALIIVAIIAGLILIPAVAVFILGTLGLSPIKLTTQAPPSYSSTEGSVSNLGVTGSYTTKTDISESANSPSGNDSGERKMIKTGSLELLVKSAEQAAADMQGIAERLGCFVSASNIYEVSASTKTGTVTIRVAASNFNQAIEETKKLAIKVERESVNAQDVTEQYVDLESRLRNLQAQEQQYLQILKQAVKIPDILQVTAQLDQVRMKIEQIQGQLNYLSRQVDMASLSANLTEEADVEIFGLRWRPLYVIKQAFRNMLGSLQGYVDSMIKLIFALPVILAWLITIGLIILVCWKIGRWIWRKFLKSTSAI